MLFQKLLKPATAAGIRYVGGYVTSSTTANAGVSVTLTSLTGGIASAPAIGDIVLVSLGVASSGAPTPSITGYTTITSLFANDSLDASLFAAYKILSAADTTVTVNGGSGTGASITVYVSVWRGVDATYPFDVAATTNTGINSVLATPPAITPITTGSYIVAAGAGAEQVGVQSYTSSDLSGFLTASVNNSQDSIIGGGYKAWTSGTFTPATFGYSGTDGGVNSWAAATLALRPTGRTYPTLIASTGANSVSSITVPSHNAGDWILFVNGANSTTAPTTTSGFTSLGTITNTGAGLLRSAQIQYKVSDGTTTSLACTFFGAVAIIRNATSISATKFFNNNSTTPVTALSVSMNPTSPGSLCVLGSYGAGNLTSATGLTLATLFGGYTTTPVFPVAISGTLTYGLSIANIHYGIEFY